MNEGGEDVQFNENLQDAAAKYLEAQAKIVDLQRKMFFMKIYLAMAIIFVIALLWPKIQLFLANFWG